MASYLLENLEKMRDVADEHGDWKRKCLITRTINVVKNERITEYAIIGGLVCSRFPNAGPGVAALLVEAVNFSTGDPWFDFAH